MAKTEAARRRCNCGRAKARPGRTQQSIAREYDKWTRIAGIVIGIVFGAMFALAIVSG